MFSSFIKISFRNILRDKQTSFINIFGLSLGLVCTLFIFIYVKGELSYDRGFPKSENIFRVTDKSLGDNPRHWAATPPVLSELMKDIPEVKDVGRLFYAQNQVLKYTDENGQEKIFEESEGYYADASIPGIFDLVFKQGDPKTALEDISSIVLTEETAKRYFGNDDPLGKILINNQEGLQLLVTGVIEELPNSHIKLKYLISMATLSASGRYPLDSRTWNGFYTYVLLNNRNDADKLANEMDDLTVELYSEQGLTREEILTAGVLQLQPITDIHLHSDLEKEIGTNGSITTIYIFSTAAFLILLLACINFINISTVQSLKRMKEVGIRKAIGTSRLLLIKQFLTESLTVSLIAAISVLVLVSMGLPVYNHITGTEINMRNLLNFQSIASIVFVIFLVGFLSGIYPAFYFSGFKPISALKGNKSNDQKVSLLRKSLVVLQFAVSIFMIVSTIIIYSQLSFLQEKNPGFDKNQVLSIQLNGQLRENIRSNPSTFKEKLESYSFITSTSLTSRLPGERFGMGTLKFVNESKEIPGVRYMKADGDFLETMGIDLLKGSNFRKPASDSGTAFIINQKAFELLTDPLGKEISGIENSDLSGPIVGVIEDFNFASLHNRVDPLVIQYQDNSPKYLLVKYKGKDINEVLETIKKEIEDYAPESLFLHSFLNERMNVLYASEKKVSEIFRIFTGLALIISCLGLFGLSAYSTELRTKEIGIRKILGASTNSLVLLLSKQFIILVLLAILVGLPPALYFCHEWLSEFAYRIDVKGLLVAYCCIGTIIISLFPISYHTIKSSMANPVHNLKTE